MKNLALVGGLCASFLFGATLSARAQDQHQNDRQPAAQQDRQDNRQDQARPEQRQNQDEDRQNMNRPEQNRQNDHNRQNQQRQDNGRDADQGGRRDQAHPEGQARGEARGRGSRSEANPRRIPDQDFRAHFGREHRFAPGRMQVYDGRPRFFYSGYTFELLQPWPSDWAFDEDDCYIDYIDGSYWLFNDLYPGEQIPVIIVE